MIDIKKSGYLVWTKSGKIGRTKHSDKPINGKIAVYLADKTQITENGTEIPLSFSSKGTLCDPTTLKHAGFID